MGTANKNRFVLSKQSAASGLNLPWFVLENDDSLLRLRYSDREQVWRFEHSFACPLNDSYEVVIVSVMSLDDAGPVPEAAWL